MNGSAVTSTYATVSSCFNTQLWHMRMFHLSEKGLKELAKQTHLGGDVITKLKFCEECFLGKSQKTSYDTDKHTTKALMDYVHYDIWGYLGLRFIVDGDSL